MTVKPRYCMFCGAKLENVVYSDANSPLTCKIKSCYGYMMEWPVKKPIEIKKTVQIKGIPLKNIVTFTDIEEP